MAHRPTESSGTTRHCPRAEPRPPPASAQYAFASTPSVPQYAFASTRSVPRSPSSLLAQVSAAFERGASRFEGEFHIRTPGRTYKLLAETHEVMRRWLKAIKKAQQTHAADAKKSDEGAHGGSSPGAAGGTARPFLQRAAEPADGAGLVEEESAELDNWTDRVSTEAEVADHVLRCVTLRFRRAAAAAAEAGSGGGAGADGGGEDGGLTELLQTAHEVMEEMLMRADDFRYSEPPRLPLFHRCVREFHTNLYANLAHLFRDVAALRPMDALQLMTWLEEYRDRLALAEAPALQPPLSDVQSELVSAYAAQSRVTWEQCTVNLHAQDLSRMVRGDFDSGRDEQPTTMAPFDLMTMLNAPFSSLKDLRLPWLTNALVSVCAEVVCTYASLQRDFIYAIGDDALADGGGGGGGAGGSERVRARSGAGLPADGATAALAVCAVINNAEQTMGMLTSLAGHIDDGEEEEEEAAASDVVDEERSARDEGGGGVGALPVGNAAARESLEKAERALQTISASGVGVLAVVCLYRSCAPGGDGMSGGGGRPPTRPALMTRELLCLQPPTLNAALRTSVASLLVVRSKLAEVFVAKLERAVLQLLVASIIDSLITGKPNLLCESSGAGAQAALHAVSQMKKEQGVLAFVDEPRAAELLAPLQHLIRLGTCALPDFSSNFAQLRGTYAEAGILLAESVLSRRGGMAKAELKDVALASTAGPGVPPPEGVGNWAADVALVMAGSPFALAASKLLGSGKGGLAKGLFGRALGKMRRGSGDGPDLGTRGRQMSGTI